MLPSLPHRLLIALVAGVGGTCWVMGALPWLGPVDGSAGITLLDAWPGAGEAGLALIVAGLPVMLGAAIVAATGNPIGGAFVMAAGLTLLATAGGGSQGYWWRHPGSAGYGPLIVEALGWLIVGTTAYAILSAGAGWPKRMMARRQTADHPKRQPQNAPWARCIQGLIGCAASATVGGFLSSVMIQNPAGLQIVGSLVLAFLVGAMVSQLIVPRSDPLCILASPMLVGMTAYIMMWQRDAGANVFLAQLYTGQLPGIALALPIHYASAGVVGASLGVGIARSLDHARSLD